MKLKCFALYTFNRTDLDCCIFVLVSFTFTYKPDFKIISKIEMVGEYCLISIFAAVSVGGFNVHQGSVIKKIVSDFPF